MEIFIYEKQYLRGVTGNERGKLLGIGIIDLSKPFAYFYQEEDDKTYQKKWYDFLKLGRN